MKIATGSFKESFAPFAPYPGAAFASFTTKKDVSPLPIPRIPAGRLELGSIIEIEAEGEYSTTGTPNGTWGLYLGTYDDASGSTPTITTDIALSSVIVTPSAAAAFPWRMRWRGKVNKTGSSGTVIGTGELIQGTSLTAQSTFPIPITLALRTVAINTTIDNRIGVSFTWGTSSASNSVTTYIVTADVVN